MPSCSNQADVPTANHADKKLCTASNTKEIKEDIPATMIQKFRSDLFTARGERFQHFLKNQVLPISTIREIFFSQNQGQKLGELAVPCEGEVLNKVCCPKKRKEKRAH